MNKKYRKILACSASLAGMFMVSEGIAHADQVIVKPGDTLTSLAPQFHTTASELAKINHIANPNMIVVGQTLTSSEENTADPNGNQVVIVKAGDTLSKIATIYGTTVNNIKTANNLTSDMIYVGQKLTITKNADTQEKAQPQTNSQQNTVSQGIASYQPIQVPQGNQGNQNYSSNVAGSDAAAKAWIAGRESGGSYTARNGQYIGKYQLSSSYLNGDYSPANQERVADQYVASRYGSWTNAQRFWQSNGWY